MKKTFPVRRAARLGAWCGLLLALGGCSSWQRLPSLTSGDTILGFIRFYRMDIVQGNVVTKEQAALVKPGMSRAQVRDVLGSPMLTDVFHADRWDYIFTIRRQGTEPQRRDVVVYFKDDKLDRIEAGELPTEREFVASISRPLSARELQLIELTEEQKKALPRPAPPEILPEVPIGSIRSYPPLEPS